MNGQILGNGMSNKMWEGTLEHAKTCVLSGKLHVYYADEKQNIGAIFNSNFQLLGIIADGAYMSVDSLSDSEKVIFCLIEWMLKSWLRVVVSLHTINSTSFAQGVLGRPL
jgi:hypothetical protein